MQKNQSKLTVFFETPYWVGVLERYCEGKLEVCKITFGTEPKDCEIYEFFQTNFNKLSFSVSIEAEEYSEVKVNPKRLRREINRQLDARGVGTKSQQALKQQQEQSKKERKEKSRQLRDEEKQQKFEMRRQKKKEKHRGR